MIRRSLSFVGRQDKMYSGLVSVSVNIQNETRVGMNGTDRRDDPTRYIEFTALSEQDR